MNLLYFVLLVSSLIFVHELGHFLFAKAFGVKVITFSLGFGPKILRLRGRETEYCVGLLPLGGYVKMLEASKSDIVLPEDRRRTFESLPLHKRVMVVLAGPVMNLLFPVLLYFSVFVSEGPFLPPMVGVVLPGHPAQGKLREGDRIMAVNGRDVGTFDELKRLISKSPGATLRLKVFRDNRHVEVEVPVEETIERRDFDIVERVGTIGIQPSAPAPVIGVSDRSSPAYRAGLRSFDVVTHVAGKPIRRYMDLDAIFADNHGETLPVTYLRPVAAAGALDRLGTLYVYEAGVVALTPEPTGNDVIERTGMELADLYVSALPQDSSLARAGLRVGDKLLRLDDEPIPAWSSFRERVMAQPDKPHRISFLSFEASEERSAEFKLRREQLMDETGQSYARYQLQLQHWVPLSPESRVEHPARIRYALTKALDETVDVTRFILIGIVRLAQGRVSLKELSGPITIYEVAGEEGRKGPDRFVWVMALLSINLGLLNLLPIPVLDGGHLLFFLVEGVLRRPLPLRVREVAHIVGMGMLLVLMGLAFKNDVEKRLDARALQQRGAP